MLVCTSTTGVSPMTVIVSCTPPTRKSALIVKTRAPLTSTPSRRTVEKPASEKVTCRCPASDLEMRYCPVPSVIAVRTFSIRARARRFDGHTWQHGAGSVADGARKGLGVRKRW